MTLETKDTRITTLMAQSELVALDDWRRMQADLPNRSEAIRRLITMGIAVEPILRDILRLIEHLNDPELAKHAESIKTALGE